MSASTQIEAPSHLSRREKYAFRRLIGAVQLQDGAFPATKSDLLADYVQSRSRIEYLADIAEKERTKGFLKDYLSTLRSLEASVALSRRLALDLGLIAEVKN
ncbi:hypothetical protein ACLBYG_15090 [Methylobacterium sp. D53M]